MNRTLPFPTQSAPSQRELLQHLSEGFLPDESARIAKALHDCSAVPVKNASKPRGAEVALILKQLDVDAQTLYAALLSDPYYRETVDESTIAEQYGDSTADLVRNVNWLNTFNAFSPEIISEPEQAETLRRMLLAMVDDVRAVLIKLAYRLERLQLFRHRDSEERCYIARETLDIFAPLANRLGIGQLKWELEDYAFRYLEPDRYKEITAAVAERRIDREHYLQDFTGQLREILANDCIEADIYGRPKHIYSIWKKMQRKKLPVHELYDLRAIRIIVDKIVTCYTVLGFVHSHWQYIPKEFDDYIANPKSNGYRSLHTVVVAPSGEFLEIQIRTKEMHEFGEFGVAAHWRYKEGGKQDVALENSINSIRKLLEDKNHELSPDFRTELYADRIFVLTPKGEIKDLARGATPLDFAYAIHTEVGHRCRGAKLNGHIVPLTYSLESGDRVEILTAKEGTPSRSWLDSSAGYLKTAHSINKVKSWFKQQDIEKNVTEGKIILEREKRNLGVREVKIAEVMEQFNLSQPNDLLARIGRADISTGQLARALQVTPGQNEQPALLNRPKPQNLQNSNKVCVSGIGNLATTFAQCCKPIPDDAIIGYITVGKVVTIHKQDCENILALSEEKKQRLVDVSWGAKADVYSINIQIKTFDREQLLRDTFEVFSTANINITGVTTHTDPRDMSVDMVLQVEIGNTEQLSKVLNRVSRLRHVFEAHQVA